MLIARRRRSKIALIGDSHAFQLSGGFKRSDYKNLYIFSYAGCPPIKNFIRQDRLYGL